jgi:hypothetical protein
LRIDSERISKRGMLLYVWLNLIELTTSSDWSTRNMAEVRLLVFLMKIPSIETLERDCMLSRLI